MAGDLIVVFGGSGFIGRYVVRALAKRGKRVRVAMRQPHLGQELRVLGGVGQIQIVQANVRFPDSVERALDGADGVVNLIGIMNEWSKQTFFNLHAEGAATIAAKADKAEIDRFIQVSAIGASSNSASRYSKSKAEGEEAVRTAIPSATILRPSVIFGPEDKFFNRLADLAKFAPFMPMLGARTRYQPLYAGDLAEAIANALDRRDARGQIYELGGPRVYSMKQLLRFILETIMRKRALIGLPLILLAPFATLGAALFRLSPIPFTPPLTGDQVTLLGKDNIVDDGAKTIADLGVTQLETIEAVVPSYLWRFRPHGQFEVKPAA
jgi:NADH dehydrogenase